MQALPTWAEICDHAIDSLDTSRNGLADARDWLASSWIPEGEPLQPGAGEARTEAVACMTRAKSLIDQAKNHIATARALGPRDTSQPRP